MFLLFINDLPNCCREFGYTLFADDSTLSCNFDAIINVAITINRELSKVSNWLMVNKIKTNVDKTNYMLFNFNQETDILAINMTGSVVSRVRNVRFLEVDFDDSLKLDSYISFTAGKLSRTVDLFNKLKYFFLGKP